MKTKCLVHLLLFFVFCAAAAYGDYVEVRRAATAYVDPDRTSETAFRAEQGANLHLVESEQTNGYYHVEDPKTGTQGWIYRTLVRRFPGDVPQGISAAGTKSTLGVPFPV